MSRFAPQILALAVALPAIPVQADRTLAVPAGYHAVARETGVPAGLLFAIALTESGRSKDGRTLPWPWAMNVRGQSMFFGSRREAEASLRRLTEEGETPDVGLMQVSLRWHPRKLGATPFEPYANLRAGAAVLREEYRRTGDWWSAVARYHSADPERGAAYRARVLSWYRRVES